MKYLWNVRQESSFSVERLSEEISVSPLLARLLLHRGISDPDLAQQFLNPSLSGLHDPFLMTDMELVVTRIFQARDRRERVLIYGDYDVDGITSTVVLKRALQMLGIDADFHMPRRLLDGYGLQIEALRDARERGFDLVISADSGIRAFESCRAAREWGLDLIVTDHHVPADRLPDAYAILNPKREDCEYPEKNLAAVGVVFKLVQALFDKAGKSAEIVQHFLKLVAIGTVADIVPLTGENRIIVKHGMEGLADPRNIGLRELLAGCGIRGAIDLFDINFKIAPRINAVTRMGGGREVVDLFSLRDPEEARGQVQEMSRKNELRRAEEAAILREIEQRYAEDPGPFEDRKFLVVAGRDWHRGVIGIVASRLVDRFYRPTLVLSLGDSMSQGSGRSIPGFNLVQALDEHAGFFKSHGGHAQAVGCRFDPESFDDGQLSELSQSLDSYAGEILSEDDLSPKLDLDCFVPSEEISFPLLDEIQRLAPYGCGNPVPVLASRNMRVVGGPWVLKNDHLKFRVQANGAHLDAIWWKNGDVAESIASGSRLDMAFTMSREEFRGETKLLLTIRDLEPEPVGTPELVAGL